MKKETNQKPIDSQRMEKARNHIHSAIGEILLGNAGVELARTISQLYKIDDILWQFATPEKGA